MGHGGGGGGEVGVEERKGWSRERVEGRKKGGGEWKGDRGGGGGGEGGR